MFYGWCLTGLCLYGSLRCCTVLGDGPLYGAVQSCTVLYGPVRSYKLGYIPQNTRARKKSKLKIYNLFFGEHLRTAQRVLLVLEEWL